jgi:hypothetical protein
MKAPLICESCRLQVLRTYIEFFLMISRGFIDKRMTCFEIFLTMGLYDEGY